MATLRFPWLWWGLGWVLVGTVCFGSLVPSRAVRFYLMNDKLIHAVAYGVLMMWFAGLCRRDREMFVAAVLIFALGLVLDLLQSQLATRYFDPWDVAANGGGILIAWIVARLALAGWCERVERAFTA